MPIRDKAAVGILCPQCKHGGHYTLDSRPSQGFRRRRLRCVKCNHRYTTHERIAEDDAPVKMIHELAPEVAELIAVAVSNVVHEVIRGRADS
jgi:transcriptional regulator NrdR family protein